MSDDVIGRRNLDNTYMNDTLDNSNNKPTSFLKSIKVLYFGAVKYEFLTF